MSMTRRGRFAFVSRGTAAAWIAGFIIGIAASAPSAQERSAQAQVEQEPIVHRVAEVERLFWLCDYVATTRGVDLTPVDVCGAATEELKNAKFGGDFMALLEWWRGNKPEEHARLAHLTTQPVTSGQRENDVNGARDRRSRSTVAVPGTIIAA